MTSSSPAVVVGRSISCRAGWRRSIQQQLPHQAMWTNKTRMTTSWMIMTTSWMTTSNHLVVTTASCSIGTRRGTTTRAATTRTREPPIHQSTMNTDESTVAAVAVALATTFALTLTAMTTITTTKSRAAWTTTANEEEGDNEFRPKEKSLHVDFMDRLALQPYLHYLDKEDDEEDDYDTTTINNTASTTRPPGIPHSLRIVTVDLLPQILNHVEPPFSCEWVSSRNYQVAGVAPPKRVPVFLSSNSSSNNSNNTMTTAATIRPYGTSNNRRISSMDDHGGKDTRANNGQDGPMVHVSVEQKAWAQALYHCVNPSTGKVGVQILEASTSQLNPYNLRRTHEYGRWHYNRDKYKKDYDDNDNNSNQTRLWRPQRFSSSIGEKKDATNVVVKDKEKATTRTISILICWYWKPLGINTRGEKRFCCEFRDK